LNAEVFKPLKPLEPLDMAIYRRRPNGVIHHSDQGCQYASTIERLPLIEAISVDALLARDRSDRRAIAQRQLNNTPLFRERQATTWAALIRSF
jgi:hypothetical protein